MSSKTPERIKKSENIKKRQIKRQISTTYCIPNGENLIKVCGKTFRSIFQVGDKRVKNIAKYVKTNNNTRPERRGGSRLDLQTLEKRQELKQKIK
jgi:hypothetical protein